MERLQITTQAQALTTFTCRYDHTQIIIEDINRQEAQNSKAKVMASRANMVQNKSQNLKGKEKKKVVLFVEIQVIMQLNVDIE